MTRRPVLILEGSALGWQVSPERVPLVECPVLEEHDTCLHRLVSISYRQTAPGDVILQRVLPSHLSRVPLATMSDTSQDRALAAAVPVPHGTPESQLPDKNDAVRGGEYELEEQLANKDPRPTDSTNPGTNVLTKWEMAALAAAYDTNFLGGPSYRETSD